MEQGYTTMKYNMGCRFQRGRGLARAQSEIGLMCLIYNMARLRFLETELCQGNGLRRASSA